MDIDSEHSTLEDYMENLKVRDFVHSNLRSSLKVIGCSDELIEYIIEHFPNYKDEDIAKYVDELHQCHHVNFISGFAPDLFEAFIIPELIGHKKVLDIGCGTGILAERMMEVGNFEKILGIDVIKYPQWDSFDVENVELRLVKEDDFKNILLEFKPDVIVMTWALHHMEVEEQGEYLSHILNHMPSGSKIVCLEDAYSEDIPPEHGKNIHNAFFDLSVEERKQVLSIFDWLANRILAQRKTVNIPCTYRTLEKWISLAEENGFVSYKKRYIGFPDNRDVNNPQSLFIIEKP